jgi:histone-lysine N-methyltransferase SETD2
MCLPDQLFPHVKHVVDKFHNKLPKEELKKFAREVNKKLVSSDYKNNRVEDPTSIPPKQAKKVRKYAHDFFDRAVTKYTEHEKKARNPGKPTTFGAPPSQPGGAASSTATPAKDDVTMSDVEADTSPGSSAGRKRKREDDDEHDDQQAESPGAPPSETPSVKRVKEYDVEADGDPTTIPSPPTPPPPPVDTPPTEEDRSMREQEEALMRENEEAQRLEDEAQAEEDGKVRTNGTAVAVNAAVNGRSSGGGGGLEMGTMEMDTDEPPQQDRQHPQQQAVLGH